MDDDLDAPIRSLLFLRLARRHDRMRIPQPLCFDAIGSNAHVLDQPGFDRFRPAKTQIQIVRLGSKGIRVALNA